MANTYDKVIKIAEAEVGYLEKKSNSNLYDKTANAGSANYTKYAYEMDTKYTTFYNGKKNGFAWCDCFVDWCFIKAYGESSARSMLYQPTKSAGAGCPYSANYYRNNKAFYSSPKVGDQIFFGSKGKETHTGIVYKVDSSKVYTIEGNTSSASGVVANGGAVAKKSYPLGYAKICGYGRPKYSQTTNAQSQSVQSNTNTTGTSTIKELPKITTYTNVSGKDIDVFSDTTCKNKIGSLNSGSTCKCLGVYNGCAVLYYKVVSGNYYKVGFTKDTRGVKT